MTTLCHLSGLSHLDNFIVTRKSCPSTGTVQKLMPTPTQTATPYTTGPLYVITFSESSARLHHDWFAGLPGQMSYSLTASQRVTNLLNLDCRKPAFTSQACFFLTANLFHLDRLLTCTLPGLPRRKLAYGNSRFCFGRRYKTGS